MTLYIYIPRLIYIRTSTDHTWNIYTHNRHRHRQTDKYKIEDIGDIKWIKDKVLYMEPNSFKV